MPRKFITQEVKDQNRESQRRSRARRTELINDLKKQVQDYQQQGASASFEMQRMAQAVTLENQRLRTLLNQHGVSQDEINRYISPPSVPLPGLPTGLCESGALRCKACGSTSIMLENSPSISLLGYHQNHQIPPQVADDSALPSPSVSCETVEPTKVENKNEMGIDTSVLSSPLASQSVHLDPRTESSQERTQAKLPQSPKSSKRQCCGPRSNAGDNQCSEKPLEVKPHLVQPHPVSNPTAPELNSPTDTMETSCDTAASILVDLHHHMDIEQVRAALGCSGSETCTVSNIKIFQLLENLE
ncbi:hypothetical protein V8C35DRAFT_281332 [Trichoderma chlorosporum]